jgi:hypothetical protein
LKHVKLVMNMWIGIRHMSTGTTMDFAITAERHEAAAHMMSSGSAVDVIVVFCM